MNFANSPVFKSGIQGDNSDPCWVNQNWVFTAKSTLTRYCKVNTDSLMQSWHQLFTAKLTLTLYCKHQLFTAKSTAMTNVNIVWFHDAVLKCPTNSDDKFVSVNTVCFDDAVLKCPTNSDNKFAHVNIVCFDAAVLKCPTAMTNLFTLILCLILLCWKGQTAMTNLWMFNTVFDPAMLKMATNNNHKSVHVTTVCFDVSCFSLLWNGRA